MEALPRHLSQVSQLLSNGAKVPTEEGLTPKPMLHPLPLDDFTVPARHTSSEVF